MKSRDKCQCSPLTSVKHFYKRAIFGKKNTLYKYLGKIRIFVWD